MTPLIPYRFVPCRQIREISRRCFNRPESPDTMIPGEVERHNRNPFRARCDLFWGVPSASLQSPMQFTPKGYMFFIKSDLTALSSHRDAVGKPVLCGPCTATPGITCAANSCFTRFVLAWTAPSHCTRSCFATVTRQQSSVYIICAQSFIQRQPNIPHSHSFLTRSFYNSLPPPCIRIHSRNRTNQSASSCWCSG
jgi:hypothetical protein